MTRVIAAAIVVVVLAGVVLAIAGLLHFQDTTNQSTITIDKKELNEKTEEVGREIVDRTSKALRKAAEGMERSADDKHAPTKTPTAGDESTSLPDRSKNAPANGGHESDR